MWLYLYGMMVSLQNIKNFTEGKKMSFTKDEDEKIRASLDSAKKMRELKSIGIW